VKPVSAYIYEPQQKPFSILKRIVMGETSPSNLTTAPKSSFSILKRIVMGETQNEIQSLVAEAVAFSILKRIVMGETW